MWDNMVKVYLLLLEDLFVEATYQKIAFITTFILELVENIIIKWPNELVILVYDTKSKS